jgi:hypothetical protein
VAAESSLRRLQRRPPSQHLHLLSKHTWRKAIDRLTPFQVQAMATTPSPASELHPPSVHTAPIEEAISRLCYCVLKMEARRRR